jgi:polyphosphate kinase 2
MSKNQLSDNDLKLLNSKTGIYTMLTSEKIDLRNTVEELENTKKLRTLQEDLIKLQNWVVREGKKVIVILEGRDFAGKGGAIKCITEFLNPRNYRMIALGIPTEEELKQWYFQRYVQYLPKPGQIVFFDRSWYNRAMVEPVNGFCTKKEYQVFMTQVKPFERMLIQSDTYLLKFYYSISKEEQARRFDVVRNNPLKKWKMSPVDKNAQKLWDVYTEYEEKMLKKTSNKRAPWHVIDANFTSAARLETIKCILKEIPYKTK